MTEAQPKEDRKIWTAGEDKSPLPFRNLRAELDALIENARRNNSEGKK